MRKNKKRSTAFLLTLFLFLGIGYAFLRTELKINGTATIKDASWNIYFDNLVVNDDSVEILTGNSAASISSNKTEVTYAITLKEPGDFYEFTVDAVNAGSINGMVDVVTSKMNNVDLTELPAYLEYSATYIDGSPIRTHHLLQAGESKKIKVRIGFRKNITSNDLPGSALTNSFSFSIVYIQADNEAIPVNPTRPCTYEGNLVQGAEYQEGQYTYRYKQMVEGVYNQATDSYPSQWINMDGDGWGVVLSDKNSTDPVTTELCTTINDKPIISMTRMFYESKTTSIDTTSFNTSNVTSMKSMFEGTTNLATVDLTTFNTSNVTDMGYMFKNSSITSFDLSSFNTSKVESMTYMFSNIHVDAMNINNFDVSNVLDISGLLSGASFSTLKLPRDLDLRKATNIGTMFQSITYDHLDLSNMITRDATDMSYMFQSSTIGELILPNDWDVRKVKTMRGTFYALNTPSIDLSGMKTRDVTDFHIMFTYSTAKSIIFSENFVTNKVTDMNNMFQNVPIEGTLDISNFSIDSLIEKTNMFYNCGASTVLVKSDAIRSEFMNGTGKPSGMTITVK